MWLRQNRHPPHSTRRALFLSSQFPAHWKWHVKVAPGSRRQNQSREYHCVWSPLEQCLYVRSFSKLDSRESDRTENICVSTKSCTMLRIMRMQAKWGKIQQRQKKIKADSTGNTHSVTASYEFHQEKPYQWGSAYLLTLYALPRQKGLKSATSINYMWFSYRK